MRASYSGHKDVKAMFTVDGSTWLLGEIMQDYDLRKKGIVAGGFDLLPKTLTGINDGYLEFTIDQQPYLQGFYTVMEMFAYKVSGGLVGPATLISASNSSPRRR